MTPRSRETCANRIARAPAQPGIARLGRRRGTAAATTTTARRSAPASRDECQIDALPQSWAVLSGSGSEERTSSRVGRARSASRRSRSYDVIKLFDPPFDHSAQNPGYIKGYVPGVRENGGQYTHAAVWAVMAFAAAGRTRSRVGAVPRDRSDPSRRYPRRRSRRYRVEPYVMAADICTNHQVPGRGGWTRYTGSAGWMYRLILESLLGLRLDVDHLVLEPEMPKDWPGFEIHYRGPSGDDRAPLLRIKNAGGGREGVQVDTHPATRRPARALDRRRGGDGKRVLDTAWRSPGLSSGVEQGRAGQEGDRDPVVDALPDRPRSSSRRRSNEREARDDSCAPASIQSSSSRTPSRATARSSMARISASTATRGKARCCARAASRCG